MGKILTRWELLAYVAITFRWRERLAHVDKRILADGNGPLQGVAVVAGPSHVRGGRVGHVDHHTVQLVARFTIHSSIHCRYGHRCSWNHYIRYYNADFQTLFVTKNDRLQVPVSVATKVFDFITFGNKKVIIFVHFVHQDFYRTCRKGIEQTWF